MSQQQEKRCMKEPTPMMKINEISKIFHNTMREQSELHNMQNSYRSLMFHLTREDGVTQLELANLTHLKAPTVSVTIRKMENDGYVRRQVDSQDMRAVRVYLTEKGREYDNKMKAKLNDIDMIAMEGITPEESRELFRVLNKMSENLLRHCASMCNCPLHMHRQ